MTLIYFIINPISGSGQHQINLELLQKWFSPKEYQLELHYTHRKKHAIELTKMALLAQPDVIVACGGDGTIHEVAAQMVGSDVFLGIIPVGSGNGLASNLFISKEVEQAIENIKMGVKQSIDVGQVNSHYFFSNMGFGIDASIIENYEKSGSRKLISYVRAAIKSARAFEAPQLILKNKGVAKELHPLLLFISNSNEMGYSMSLTPQASLKDGLLDVLIVPKINFFQKLYFGALVVLKKSDNFRSAEVFQTAEMEVEFHELCNRSLQLDGEFYAIEQKSFHIRVLPQALKVIC